MKRIIGTLVIYATFLSGGLTAEERIEIEFPLENLAICGEGLFFVEEGIDPIPLRGIHCRDGQYYIQCARSSLNRFERNEGDDIDPYDLNLLFAHNQTLATTGSGFVSVGGDSKGNAKAEGGVIVQNNDGSRELTTKAGVTRDRDGKVKAEGKVTGKINW